MKNKINLIYFAIAVLLAIGVYVIARNNNTTAPIPVAKTSTKTFTKANGNLIVADTFVTLMNNAYKGFVMVTKTSSTIDVSITNANAITKDFFNGNDELLKYTLADFGFAIKYIASPASINAQFALQNNAVFVPNDVLIKAMDKTTNAKKSIQ
jgi:YbbR domain-containing protein